MLCVILFYELLFFVSEKENFKTTHEKNKNWDNLKMDETNRNSMKLDIEAVRLSAAEEIPKETYKPLPDSDKLDGLEKGIFLSIFILSNSFFHK